MHRELETMSESSVHPATSDFESLYIAQALELTLYFIIDFGILASSNPPKAQIFIGWHAANRRIADIFDSNRQHPARHIIGHRQAKEIQDGRDKVDLADITDVTGRSMVSPGPH